MRATRFIKQVRGLRVQSLTRSGVGREENPMKVTLQVMIEADSGQGPVEERIAYLETR